ncbi:MAG: germination protein YpeB [Tissierellia bacterium]|nr:germination protein YpeB [Tissierellia bacterium]
MDNRGRRHWIAPSILSLLLLAAIIWGYNQYYVKSKYEVALENQYQRLFYDVKKHVENVQVGLSKALVASSKERNILLFSQIMSDANFAQDKLGQLPISHAEVANTEKFLTQAADYCYYLIQKHLEGEDITPEQREALTNLQNNSAAFNEELDRLHQAMADSSFMYGVASNMGFGGRRNQEDGLGSQLQASLLNLEAGVSETPELIYDGPFADQMLNRKPVGLPQNKVSMEEAQQAAIEFFGEDRVQDVEAFELGENINEARIPAYTFNLFPNNQQRELAVYMGVAQQGGKVLWMSNPRPISNAQISVEEAEQYAIEYLKEKGFENMVSNYYLQYDGGVLFNFVNTENDITIYPDLVKVKVALDTGEIVGFDASAYYLNHQDREFDTPEISVEEAASTLREGFEVDSIRLALIPKGKREVLCYEFKGMYEDSQFIVYVNVLNGKEEEILQLIHNENGTLTF